MSITSVDLLMIHTMKPMCIFLGAARGLAAACLIGGLGRLHAAGRNWMTRWGVLKQIRRVGAGVFKETTRRKNMSCVSRIRKKKEMCSALCGG